MSDLFTHTVISIHNIWIHISHWTRDVIVILMLALNQPELGWASDLSCCLVRYIILSTSFSTIDVKKCLKNNNNSNRIWSVTYSQNIVLFVRNVTTINRIYIRLYTQVLLIIIVIIIIIIMCTVLCIQFIFHFSLLLQKPRIR